MGLAKSQQSLKDWTSQKWMTSGTHANKKRGSSKEVKANGKKRYLPEAAWDALSSGEKAATNKAKAKGNSKGKQFVSQPKGIKEKTKSFRKFGGFTKNDKTKDMKNMMYKKGGKPSKKKVMKEAKKEGESFLVENKELSFGAPQMKMGGMMKYKDGGKKGLFDKIDATTNALSASAAAGKANKDFDKAAALSASTEALENLNKKVMSAEAKKKLAIKKAQEMKKGGKKMYEKGGADPEKGLFEKIKETQEKLKATKSSESPRMQELYKAAVKEHEKMKVLGAGYPIDSGIENSIILNPSGYKKANEVSDLLRENNKKFTPASKKKGGTKSMEPGGGGRFAKMVKGLKKEGKSEESAKAIAASIGRKKYGKSKFQAMAAAGKKRMGGKKC